VLAGIRHYNNGIVIVADEASFGPTAAGGPGLVWLKGMQIVNGGQTTASIYFVKKKEPEIDLRAVRVPAKVIILRLQDPAAEESLISDVSRFANSQTSVKQSDLSANKPWHVAVEKLALSTYTPDGVGRWFYERAAGSYKTWLAREGDTPARLRHLRDEVPPARKITKTDLATYLNAWDRKPDIVSLGAQKNFDQFMSALTPPDGSLQPPLPDVPAYKSMIAKAILFKKTQSLVRPMFRAFQRNIVSYVIALLADRAGSRINLDKIWSAQDLSEALRQQLTRWASEVNDTLQRSAGGRMISEWAKKADCWSAVRTGTYSPMDEHIPELR